MDWCKYSRMALNFALQELRIFYNNIYELRFQEVKKKKGTPIIII